MIMVESKVCKFDCNVRFHAKLSYVYCSMGHIWSQYWYLVKNDVWKTIRFGVFKPMQECHMSNATSEKT